MARRSGRGVTPERVVSLLREATRGTLAISQSSIAKELEIGVGTVNRYLNGTSEPTQETLEKLADFFEVSVGWLRGEGDELAYTIPSILKLAGKRVYKSELDLARIEREIYEAELALEANKQELYASNAVLLKEIMLKYPDIISEFINIPINDRDAVILALSIIKPVEGSSKKKPE